MRVIVPFAPGGSDIPARMLAQKLTEKLGQTFVVDNRAGAAGVVGAEIVARAPADGYTLLFCTASHAVTAVYYRKLPYDPIRDFAPVAAVGSVPFVLVTHPALPVRSIKEFVALAKARPGQLFYSSAGTGGIGHLASELFADRAGIKVTHVGYKGTGPALTAILSGEVQFAILNLAGCTDADTRRQAEAARGGERRALAARAGSFHHQGIRRRSGKRNLVRRAGAARRRPQYAIDVLNREINALLKSREFHEQLAARGVVADIMSPQEFSAFVRSEIDKWGGVMKDAGIKQED